MKNIKLFLVHALILLCIFQMRESFAADSTSTSAAIVCKNSFTASFSHGPVASGSGGWFIPANLIVADIKHGGTLCPGTYNVSITCDNFYTNDCEGNCSWYGSYIGSCAWQLKGQDSSWRMVVQNQIYNGTTGTNTAPQCEYGNPNPNTANFSMSAVGTMNTSVPPYQITNVYFGLESGGVQHGTCTIVVTH